jgi:iron(III) transport system substrate-binding protein
LSNPAGGGGYIPVMKQTTNLGLAAGEQRGLSRRAALAGVAKGVGAIALGGGVLGSCRARRAPGSSVVLYTSCDDFLAREVVQEFERESGLKVLMAGDTEATKTTGLVERLLSEQAKPKADVWWSNELLGTVLLANRGLFRAYDAPADAEMPGGWPESLRDGEGLWYGHALRARSIVYSSARMSGDDVPRRLAELTGARWRGVVGMARPFFGTTRMHAAALVATSGAEKYEAWLRAMVANGTRFYSGNSGVVRGVAAGEIDIGLTDTDDVFVSQSEGLGVDQVYETKDGWPAHDGLASLGPLVIPNTIALVAGGPNPGNAERLAGYLLSSAFERKMAAHITRHTPVRGSVVVEPAPPKLDPELWVTAGALASASARADEIGREVVGLG